MKKYNKKHSKRIRNLVALCTLCAILLSVSTYAWFIGMKTVNVDAFTINVATTEGLYLSMDGVTWDYELDIMSANQYAGNTNQINGTKANLIPMSTIGQMDSNSSTMMLYEKASLTAKQGNGYRLLASRVNNQKVGTNATGSESAGYIAFDLFIKNLSGEAYYTENNPLNEEAIYLTQNSAVKVTSGGSEESNGVANTGIENSVRVAFAQIGRVIGTTTTATNITGITCANNTTAGVTGICRNAVIWEPNDMDHEANAINWYQTSCKKRNNATTYGTEACGAVKDGSESDAVYVHTYAVGKAIAPDNFSVDVYDGADYNGYTSDVASYASWAGNGTLNATSYLVDFDYFTDTEKNITGPDRPTFMTLAPNSITKVRVYVYIEGQDIDNYDFAQLGKSVTVNFGFTKERYKDDEYQVSPNISYDNVANTSITDQEALEEARRS